MTGPLQKEFNRILPRFNQYVASGNIKEAISLTDNLQLQKILKNKLINESIITLDGITWFPEAPFDIYSMDVDSISVLVEYVRKHQPKTILEFGSGQSTFALSQIIDGLSGYAPDYSSFDDNKELITHYQKILTKYGLNHVTSLYYTPLSKQFLNWRLSSFYDFHDIVIQSESDSIDLVIIDGPIGYNKKNARRPAYYAIKQFLSKHGAIFLDDTNRPDEKQAIEDWSRDIPNSSITWYDSSAMLTF
jgi:predicted O-methyltransferase YrrM